LIMFIMIHKARAYPRAALIGNPSDGYFGKTIAFTFSNFHADVTLYDSPELEILPARRDQSRFSSLETLASDVDQYGYYGGIRLIKASLKKFHSWCEDRNIPLHKRNFTIRYHTNIPAHLGLAGSSAIITASMKVLMAFYKVEIPEYLLASLVLSVETEELGIGAGLQDRVAQAYNGIVHMDFKQNLIKERGYGEYTRLINTVLPDYYIAYKVDSAEGTEVFHNNLRYRWENEDIEIIKAMKGFARLTDDFRAALEAGETGLLNRIINANFDLRQSIMNLNPDHERMVQTAREAGASAKFTGSGGALIGITNGKKGFKDLKDALEAMGCCVIRPQITQ
jgi:galactokinase/mevalonate kinase-like predicted kinase